MGAMKSNLMFVGVSVAAVEKGQNRRASISVLSSPRRLRSRPTRRCQRCRDISMSWHPAGVLRDAVEIKKVEIELMEETLTERPDHPINMVRSFFAHRTSHRFSQALRRKDGTLAIVAALKRFQAPRIGEEPHLVARLDDIAIESRALEYDGVDAALLFTDNMRYGIEIGEMKKISKELKTSTQDLGMPLARQDLIIDPIQIAEAAEAGACAVNIIAAAALPDIMELMNAATAMGLESIIECHTALERDFAIECGATMLYLTNWDRSYNRLVPGISEQLIDEVPPWVVTLGGGGLVTASDCWKLLDAGFNGVVLGETLLQSRRTSSFIDEIRSQRRFSGDIFGNPFMGDVE